MTAQVFLSYSRKDARAARTIARALEQHGFEAWFGNTDLEAGESITRRITEALGRSSALVAIISKQSLKSPWIFVEIGAAWAMEKPVFTLVLRDAELTGLPDWVSTTNSIKVEGDLRRAARELSAKLAAQTAG